jgi:prolyl-tRNA synthetase
MGEKGVPLRLEIGPKDLVAGQCVLVRRDTGEKIVCLLADVENTVKDCLKKFSIIYLRQL